MGLVIRQRRVFDMAEIKDIPDAVKAQIAELERQGLELLGLSADSAPADVVAAITEHVRQCKAAHASMHDDQVYALGALLGCQYVRGLHWHWAAAVWDFDEENGAIGVLNQDDSLFNNPIGWIGKVLDSEGGTPFMLSYNMIKAHQVPVFEPGSATPIY